MVYKEAYLLISSSSIITKFDIASSDSKGCLVLFILLILFKTLYYFFKNWDLLSEFKFNYI